MAELPDNFLLSYTGFDAYGNHFIDAETESGIARHAILDRELSLQFDLSKRYCTGWVDFDQMKQKPCSDHAIVDSKYDQCVKCRNLTGFNPAFYNATTVSKQQEAINQRPHFVYLVYFSPGLIKVGISQESRGIRRILEQGARLAIKLETFPSALVARQYEANIAKLSGIIEHVTSSKKLAALKTPLDESAATAELMATKDRIETIISVKFSSAELITTSRYFKSDNLDLELLSIIKDQPFLIGKTRAIIGSTIIIEHDDRLLAYNLKDFIGYHASPADNSTSIELPSEQMMLF